MKLPQPWKSIGGLRRHFLDGFPPLFEKADAKNALAFSQFQQVRRRLTFYKRPFPISWSHDWGAPQSDSRFKRINHY